MTDLFSRFAQNALVRWVCVGILFYLIGLAILRIMVESLGLPLTLSTLFTQEAATIVRYIVNDRWVFHEKRLSWTRLWQFHVAGAGGGAIWLITTNVMAKLGVNYLVASTIGTASSMLLTMAANFLWIWRKRTAASAGEVESAGAVAEVADAR